MAKETIFSIMFIINGIALAGCSIAYAIKWTNYDSTCGESQDVITTICAMAAFVYGGGALATIAFYTCFVCKKCDIFSKMMTIILTFSAGGLVFSVVSGCGMLISLYFGFDPSCLANDKSKIDFVLLWVLALYAVVSNAVFLFAVSYFFYKKDDRKSSQSSFIYMISPPKIYPDLEKV